MSGYQKVTILGRLGRDPELTYTQSGMAICKFSLATSRKKKNGEEITAWHRCTAFDKAGEIIGKYMAKGRELLIEGELSYGKYDKDGVTHYITDVIVNRSTFVGSGGNQQGQQPVSNQNNNQQHGYNPNNTSNSVPETDIPF